MIFIEYDLGIGNALSPIYSLIIDLAIKEILSRNDSHKGKCYFVLDEFALLPEVKHLENALNFGRGLGTSFVVGLQNISQLYTAYGHDRANNIMSGFSTTVCFRLNDAESRDNFRKLCGKNYVFFAFDTGNGAETRHFMEDYIISESDLTNLRKGDAIVKTGNYPPFFFHFEFR